MILLWSREMDDGQINAQMRLNKNNHLARFLLFVFAHFHLGSQVCCSDYLRNSSFLMRVFQTDMRLSTQAIL